MEDDTESVVYVPKLQELPIIQIFGFDGELLTVESDGKLRFSFQEKSHSKFIPIKIISFLQSATRFQFST